MSASRRSPASSPHRALDPGVFSGVQSRFGAALPLRLWRVWEPSALVPRASSQIQGSTNETRARLVPHRTLVSSVEGMGFEPMRGLPLGAFKAPALGRYANPPRRISSHPRPVAAHRLTKCATWWPVTDKNLLNGPSDGTSGQPSGSGHRTTGFQGLDQTGGGLRVVDRRDEIASVAANS